MENFRNQIADLRSQLDELMEMLHGEGNTPSELEMREFFSQIKRKINQLEISVTEGVGMYPVASASDDAAIARNAEFEESQDAAPNPRPCVDEDPDTEPTIIDDDPDTEPPLLDEEVTESTPQPANHPAGKPMIKMFTLNDRYRFRRELFGNLDAAMAETLETLSVMDDIDQAVSYLEDDLCWDMTLPEVEEFVAAITPYYTHR